MTKPLIIHKNRTNIVQLSLGMDVSSDTFTSDIKAVVSPTATPLVSFTIAFATDGTDGELVLRIDDSALANVTAKFGYMDLKRLSNGEPLSVFLEPLKVEFQGVVTA